ncbi:hypothetical protein Nepgr_013305 [Nepenthes gracilis]|uniref:Uncharacterized protein n=1 Tax=Nepenthes gracilis TaxID=150966 RepID=A0AAD3SIZ0_NEPGR|nr:hypothetical protein Nepgr_013305 [Nepenthes gracilis]
MATENQRDTAAASKSRRGSSTIFLMTQEKGFSPLRPGKRGFFITCDGGKERQDFMKPSTLWTPSTEIWHVAFQSGLLLLNTTVPDPALKHPWIFLEVCLRTSAQQSSAGFALCHNLQMMSVIISIFG